jgi:hypothetical protein
MSATREIVSFRNLDRITLALISLTSGAALIVSVVFRVSLGLTLAVLGLFVATTSAFALRQATQARSAEMKILARAGATAGAIATIAYDGIRFLVVDLFRLNVRPFETFELFGRLIVGTNAPKQLALTVGTSYHYLNGTMFGAGYALVFGARDWKYGIVWAFGLETMMLGLYPGWLHINGLLKEFTVVSLTGHLAYGFALGALCQWMLLRSAKLKCVS